MPLNAGSVIIYIALHWESPSPSQWTGIEPNPQKRRRRREKKNWNCKADSAWQPCDKLSTIFIALFVIEVFFCLNLKYNSWLQPQIISCLCVYIGTERPLFSPHLLNLSCICDKCFGKCCCLSVCQSDCQFWGFEQRAFWSSFAILKNDVTLLIAPVQCSGGKPWFLVFTFMFFDPENPPKPLNLLMPTAVCRGHFPCTRFSYAFWSQVNTLWSSSKGSGCSWAVPVVWQHALFTHCGGPLSSWCHCHRGGAVVLQGSIQLTTHYFPDEYCTVARLSYSVQLELI